MLRIIFFFTCFTCLFSAQALHAEVRLVNNFESDTSLLLGQGILPSGRRGLNCFNVVETPVPGSSISYNLSISTDDQRTIARDLIAKSSSIAGSFNVGFASANASFRSTQRSERTLVLDERVAQVSLIVSGTTETSTISASNLNSVGLQQYNKGIDKFSRTCGIMFATDIRRAISVLINFEMRFNTLEEKDSFIREAERSIGGSYKSFSASGSDVKKYENDIFMSSNISKRDVSAYVYSENGLVGWPELTNGLSTSEKPLENAIKAIGAFLEKKVSDRGGIGGANLAPIDFLIPHENLRPAIEREEFWRDAHEIKSLLSQLNHLQKKSNGSELWGLALKRLCNTTAPGHYIPSFSSNNITDSYICKRFNVPHRSDRTLPEIIESIDNLITLCFSADRTQPELCQSRALYTIFPSAIYREPSYECCTNSARDLGNLQNIADAIYEATFSSKSFDPTPDELIELVLDIEKLETFPDLNDVERLKRDFEEAVLDLYKPIKWFPIRRDSDNDISYFTSNTEAILESIEIELSREKNKKAQIIIERYRISDPTATPGYSLKTLYESQQGTRFCSDENNPFCIGIWPFFISRIEEEDAYSFSMTIISETIMGKTRTVFYE